jgi:hypothetical protein
VQPRDFLKKKRKTRNIYFSQDKKNRNILPVLKPKGAEKKVKYTPHSGHDMKKKICSQNDENKKKSIMN